MSVCLLGAAGAIASGCDWTELDAIAQRTVTPPPTSGAPEVDASADASLSANVDSSEVSGATDATPVEESPSASLACASSVTPIQEWTFDTGVENWTSSADKPGVVATLSWNASVGDPSPGALQAHVTPIESDAGAISGTWVAYDLPTPTDLSSRTISAWVRLESGPSPHLKTFVQTGLVFIWADNGTTYLAPNTWTCLSLAPSSPSYTQPSYDPTEVVRLGFEMLGTTPFVLTIDDVRYY